MTPPHDEASAPPDLAGAIAQLRVETRAGRIAWGKIPADDGYQVAWRDAVVQIREIRFFQNAGDYDGYPGHRATLSDHAGTTLALLDGSVGDDAHRLKDLFELARASVRP
jgi:hypothetical protein